MFQGKLPYFIAPPKQDDEDDYDVTNEEEVSHFLIFSMDTELLS